MLTLRLPDGSVRQAAGRSRPREIAESIGKRLARDAVAARVNDKIVDLDSELPESGEVSFQILTDKDPAALEVLRHSCAHVIAGAYWKNDASRHQLQRLYGTAFFSQKELDTYITQLEEAKKRDHRVLGKQLKLFTISNQVGSGLILWMPKGAMVRGILESFIKD